MPKVSVLIPTYNQREVVAETVRSALGQDIDDLEVIVSDDGSADGTQEVLQELEREFAPRMRLLLSERNQGIPVNFNRLLDNADGDFIAWLGGDDVMLPGKLRRQVDALLGAPEAVACLHDAEVIDAHTGEVHGRFSTLFNGAPGLREGGVEMILDPFYMTLPSTMMLRRSACTHRFDTRLRYANDWLWTVEALTHGRCVVFDDVLVQYRRTGSNVTQAPGAARLGFEESMMAMALVAARHPELAPRARAVRGALLVGEGRRAMADGGPRQLVRFAWAGFTEAGVLGSARLAGMGLRSAAGRLRPRSGAPRTDAARYGEGEP